MDKVRIIVYGLLSFLILLMIFLWFARKEYLTDTFYTCFDIDNPNCKTIDITCECIGFAPEPEIWTTYCLGISINCKIINNDRLIIRPK